MNAQIFTTQVQKLTQDQSYFISNPTYLLCLQGFFFFSSEIYVFEFLFCIGIYLIRGHSGVSVGKILPASAGDARDTFDPWVRKIPLEKEMATHSSILALEISWTEEPGGLQSMESQKSQTPLSN